MHWTHGTFVCMCDIHAYTHAYTHTYTNPHIFTQALTHTHTHTHTYKHMTSDNYVDMACVNDIYTRMRVKRSWGTERFIDREVGGWEWVTLKMVSGFPRGCKLGGVETAVNRQKGRKEESGNAHFWNFFNRDVPAFESCSRFLWLAAGSSCFGRSCFLAKFSCFSLFFCCSKEKLNMVTLEGNKSIKEGISLRTH